MALVGGHQIYKHWKYRKPPDGRVESQLMKCILPQPCVFKDTCPDSHSDDELEEWRARLLLESEVDSYVNQATFSVEDHRSFINCKLDELDEGDSEKTIISELIGSHSVISDENLFIMHVDKKTELTWMFTVTCLQTPPSKELERVFLMNESPEFSIAYIFYSESENMNPLRLPEGCMLWENEHKNRKFSAIKVLLHFYSSSYGIFHQQIIFDFGGFPKVVRKIGVQVANDESLSQVMKYDPQKYGNDELSWIKKHKVIYFDSRKSGDKVHYPLPPNIESLEEYGAFKHLDAKLSKQNYRLRLHTLLFIEEYQRRADLQSITLHVDDLRACLDNVEDSNNETATILVDDYIMETLGRLVGKSGNALVRLNIYERDGIVCTDPIVYQVVIRSIQNDSFVLGLNNSFSSLLHSSAISVDVDICFCLVDIFQSLHNAVENIDLQLTFPDTSLHKSLPQKIPSTNNDKLTNDQMKVLSVLLHPSEKAPILLLGPFGAGKTRTVAAIIQKLMSNNQDKKKRILVCTHSNSAADFYIEEYFHPLHLSDSCGDEIDPWMVPLRINWEHRYTSSVSDKVLPYCLQNKDTGMFATPTKEDVENHSLVISTLMTSEILFKLTLPDDFFSHIFIDEAAQAMEVEALLPLLLATRKTKVLLAGDHMQMCETLSSNVAKSLGLGKSLLERLFEYYPFDAECKMKLLENFRSYKEIVDLSSHLFYEDSLLSRKIKPNFEKYPVEFHGVDGIEKIAKNNPSYENVEEAAKVLICLKEIQLFWNNRNVEFDLSSACVISFYHAQVRRIRNLLRQNEMSSVRVESVNNVQGREFDILIISTVRTLCDTTLFDEHCSRDMGFLTNPKLLNTALTRARYRVIIIGDPSALCSIGECKGCWKTLISVCNANHTFQYRISFKKLLEDLKVSAAEPAFHLRSYNVEKSISDNQVNLLRSPLPLEDEDSGSNVSEIDEMRNENRASPLLSYKTAVSSSKSNDPTVSSDFCSSSHCNTRNCSISTTLLNPMSRQGYTDLPHLSRSNLPSSLLSAPLTNTLDNCHGNMGIIETQPTLAIPPVVPSNFVNPAISYGNSHELFSSSNLVGKFGTIGFADPTVSPMLPKVFLPPSKNLFDLRQKINFVKGYCFHILGKVNANPAIFVPVKKSVIMTLQKVDELSQNYEICRPGHLEESMLRMECEVEKCYLFAEAQFHRFVKAHVEDLGPLYSDALTMTSYGKLRKRLSDIELFLQNEHYKIEMFDSSDRQVAGLRRELNSISCRSLLTSYELQFCQWLLLTGTSTILLPVKLDFVEQSLLEIEASQKRFYSNIKSGTEGTAASDHNSFTSSNEKKTGLNIDLHTNMESLSLKESDPDVDKWFSKRRNDLCVQEYVTSSDRHFASRLPSPPALLLGSIKFDEYSMASVESCENYCYTMHPPYIEHMDTEKARSLANTFEGRITYYYQEDYDRIHGKVLVGNILQVNINGLRRNNRALPDDRVVVRLKHQFTSITFDTPGEVICVAERSSEILTCRKINDSLVIPVKKYGPPILLHRGVGLEQINLDSSTLYKVKIIDWPLEMRYPIGVIINAGNDMCKCVHQFQP